MLDFDTHSSTFFDNATTGAAARAAVQQAADDLSAAITTKLNAISAGDAGYKNTGTDQSKSVTLDSTIGYTNPNTGATISGLTPALAQDEFKIYVGARSLTGTTLGQGGPGFIGLGAGGSGSNTGTFANAAAAASAASTADMGRGSSIVAGTLSGTIGGANYSTTFAPT